MQFRSRSGWQVGPRHLTGAGFPSIAIVRRRQRLRIDTSRDIGKQCSIEFDDVIRVITAVRVGHHSTPLLQVAAAYRRAATLRP